MFNLLSTHSKTEMKLTSYAILLGALCLCTLVSATPTPMLPPAPTTASPLGLSSEFIRHDRLNEVIRGTVALRRHTVSKI